MRAPGNRIAFAELGRRRIERFLGQLVIADYFSAEAHDHRFLLGQTIQASQVCHYVYRFGPDARSQRALRATGPNVIAIHFPGGGDDGEFGIMIREVGTVPQESLRALEHRATSGTYMCT